MIESVGVYLAECDITCHDESGNITPLEMACLVSIAKNIQAKRIFEFGTFLGYTALALAKNTDAHIWTLDLPFPREGGNPEGFERHLVDEGELVCKHDRVTQLFGDSTTFDFSDLPKMDLIFVDGGHLPEIIRVIDTLSALSMIREGGIIIWHDYLNGKLPYLTRTLQGIGKLAQLYHVTGTRLLLWECTGAFFSSR